MAGAGHNDVLCRRSCSGFLDFVTSIFDRSPRGRVDAAVTDHSLLLAENQRLPRVIVWVDLNHPSRSRAAIRSMCTKEFLSP